jgi:hypothetical protein
MPSRKSLFPKRKLAPLIGFDVSLIQRRLDGALINIDRDLQRRIRQASQSQSAALVRQLTLACVMIRIASNSYAATCFLVVDAGDSLRRKNFVLAITPLTRQVMDLLCTLVFLRDDFVTRSLAYERAGYRAFKEEYDLFQTRYGRLREWKNYFTDQRTLSRYMAKSLKITRTEKKNLKLIPRWNGPFKLSKEKTPSQNFLKWIVKWLYGEISGEAHLTGTGLFSVSPFLLADMDFVDDEYKSLIKERVILQVEARNLSRMFMTVLAIATEIDAQFTLNNHEALAYIWRILVDYVPDAKDMYAERYERMLIR